MMYLGTNQPIKKRQVEASGVRKRGKITWFCTGQLCAGDSRLAERALAARGGVLSDRFALLLAPIQEGVIRIKPRGYTL